jgi:hypothetical protein
MQSKSTANRAEKRTIKGAFNKLGNYKEDSRDLISIKCGLRRKLGEICQD